ncbi:MAG: sigma-70 family RNA polymerase sigma factor [Lysobacter sp.]
MGQPEAVESELWERYRRANDSCARDRLFLLYVPWATAIARNVHRRVRSYPVDREDFVQNATIGLLDAMSRFDPERGIAFRFYAKPRVRGAVFNGLRVIMGGRPPQRDDNRFAARLDDMHEAGDGSAFEQVVDTIVGLGIGYLMDEAAHLPFSPSTDGLAYVQAAQAEARLLHAIGQLPERLQLVVRSHYFQYVPFHVLATRMGLTKGRVSQLHRGALLRLRDLLRELE